MATRSVPADEEAAIRAMGRDLLGRLHVGAELELTSAAVEEAAAKIRKYGLDPRAEGVLFKCAVGIARVLHRNDPE